MHLYFLLAGTSTFIVSGETVDISENGRFNANFGVPVKKILYAYHMLSILGCSFLYHLKFQLDLPGFFHFHLVFSTHKQDCLGNSFFDEHRYQQESLIVSSLPQPAFIAYEYQKCSMLDKKALAIQYFLQLTDTLKGGHL